MTNIAVSIIEAFKTRITNPFWLAFVPAYLTTCSKGVINFLLTDKMFVDKYEEFLNWHFADGLWTIETWKWLAIWFAVYSVGIPVINVLIEFVKVIPFAAQKEIKSWHIKLEKNTVIEQSKLEFERERQKRLNNLLSEKEAIAKTISELTDGHIGKLQVADIQTARDEILALRSNLQSLVDDNPRVTVDRLFLDYSLDVMVDRAKNLLEEVVKDNEELRANRNALGEKISNLEKYLGSKLDSLPN